MTTYTIKPLVWEQDGSTCTAIALDGFYYISELFNGVGFVAKLVSNGGVAWSRKPFRSIEAAKAACTEHWEGMIKQALVPCDAAR